MEGEDSFFGQDYTIARWQVPEYIKYPKTKRWYLFSTIIAIGLLAFSFITSNFLFAVIIIVGSLVVYLRENREPSLVDVEVNREGVSIGKNFYSFDEMKDFSIVFQPRLGVKNLYFEFKNPVRPRLSLPLHEIDPLAIRKELLKYLKEDLERENIPLSENLAKIFKL